MARVPVDGDLALNCDVNDYLWPWEHPLPVVMLHGFARNANFWKKWVPLLGAEHRVYRPELRGFGRSDQPPAGYKPTIPSVMSDLLAVMDHFKLPKAHFVGESSGGVFAILFALAHPERVASLVLCDTPIRSSGSSAPTTRESYSLGQGNSGEAMRKFGVGEWCRQTLRFRLDLEKASPELQEWYIAEMDKTPRLVAAALNDLVRTAPSLEPLLKDLKVPVLLLAGDRSEISGDQQAAFIKEYPKAKLHTFPGYGHAVNVTTPEACAAAALEFWQGM